MAYVWERRNAYELLEIEKTATDDVIKQAFRMQSKAWHPDNFVGFDDEVRREVSHRVGKIREARERLLDDESREEEDFDIDLREPDAEWYENPDQRKPECWYAIARWMKQEDVGTPFDRKMAFRAGDYIEKRKHPGPKQVPHMLRVWELAHQSGFDQSFVASLR